MSNSINAPGMNPPSHMSPQQASPAGSPSGPNSFYPGFDQQQQTSIQVDQSPQATPTPQPGSQPSIWARKPRPWWPQLRRSQFLGDAKRVTGLDAARGIALLGMVVAHAGAIDDLGNTPRWLGFAHGRASILFAIVAGISLAIITGGRQPHEGERLLQDRLRIFTRAVVLMILASILETLGTPIAIILGAYSLWFVLSLPFVRARVSTLLIWGISFSVLGSTAIFLVQEAAFSFHYYPAGSPGNSFLALLFVSTYPAVVWMGFVLIGMAIGRSDLTRPRVLLAYGLSGLLLFAAFAAPFVAKEGLDPLLRVDADRGFPGASNEFPGSSIPLPPLPSPEPVGEEIEALAAATEPPSDLTDGVLGNQDGSIMDFMCMEDGLLYPCTGEEFEQLTSTWTDAEWERYGELLGSPKQAPEVNGPFWQRYLSSLFTMDPHSGSPFEAMSSGGFAVAVIAACVAIGRRLKYVLAPLAAVGSMSLTAYALHVIATAVLASWGIANSNAAMVWQVVGLVIFALAWAWFFQRGPLEQAMASWADRGSSLPRLRSRDRREG